MRSGGDDDRFGAMPFFLGDHGPQVILRFQARDFGALEFGALIRRLTLHRWAEIVAGYSVGEAGKVFDLLDADQMAAGDIGFQHQRGKAMARSEQAGSQPGEAGADDYDVVVCHDF